MPLSLSIAGQLPIALSQKIPPEFKQYKIAGAVVHAATTEDFICMIQEIQTKTYTVWFNVTFCKKDLTFIIKREGALALMKISLMNDLRWYFDGIGELLIKEHHFNMVFLPQFEGKTFGQKGIQYMSMDLTYSGGTVDKIMTLFKSLEPFLTKMGTHKPVALLNASRPINREIRETIDHILKYKYQDRLVSVYTHHQVSHMFFLLFQENDTPVSPENVFNHHIGGVYLVRDAIEKNKKHMPKISDLAAISGMSATKLKADFKKVFDLPIKEYWNKFRMEFAQEQLKERKKSIKNIAHELGFSSSSNFSAAFKLKYGQTPSDWRKN